MTEITDAQVERAAKAMALDEGATWGGCPTISRSAFRRRARVALQAAQEPERPAWPTTHSTNRLLAIIATAHADFADWAGEHEANFELVRDSLKAGMLADPIIKAAVEWARDVEERNAQNVLRPVAKALYMPIKNAGLLDD